MCVWLSHPGGPDQAEMQAIPAWLPLNASMTVPTTPHTPHLGDPGLAAS